jgi:hypothetical protein
MDQYRQVLGANPVILVVILKENQWHLVGSQAAVNTGWFLDCHVCSFMNLAQWELPWKIPRFGVLPRRFPKNHEFYEHLLNKWEYVVFLCPAFAGHKNTRPPFIMKILLQDIFYQIYL